MNSFETFEFTTLFLVGIAVSIGLFAGKLVRKIGLPSIIGYMVLGSLLGVSALRIFPIETVHGLAFITDIALGFVAFSIGSELNLRSLRKTGRSITTIIVLESVAALVFVTVFVYALTHDLALSIVFGSMAPATAPAGTVAVIQEFRARGSLSRALYTVAGFDDGAAIILFGFASTAARQIILAESRMVDNGFSFLDSVAQPAMELVLSMVIGVILGFIYTWLVRKLQSNNEIPALTFGVIAIGTGLATQFGLSLILLNMSIGFVVVNSSSNVLSSTITTSLRSLMPLLFILFFFLAGAHLDLAVLHGLGLVGIVYILSRSAGKMTGAYFGAVIGRADRKIRKYLGMGLLSQAGVAIGLSLLVRQQFASIPGDHAALISSSVVTTITATCIVFEIVGPVITKIALKKAGEIPEGPAGDG
jgi:Kef-type K+ transport system membrane component KefB